MARAVFFLAFVALTGAACHTSYAYRAVELRPVSVSRSDHSTRDALRILVFGDPGMGNSRQARVAEGMTQACSLSPCDFGLVLGDIIYDTGIRSADDPQLGPKFHDFYDDLQLELWLAPGNHDWYSPASLQPAIDHTNAPGNAARSWNMPFNYFPVPGMPAWLHLFALDTTVFHDLARQPDSEHRTALQAVADEQLAEARRQLCGQPGWRVLFGHHFVYSNGSTHGVHSGELAPWLEPLIRDCDVQLFLSGHDHHLEHLVAEDFDQVITGSAGEARGLRTPPTAGADQRFAVAELGFVTVEVSRDQLTLIFHECDADTGCRVVHQADVPADRTAGPRPTGRLP